MEYKYYSAKFMYAFYMHHSSSLPLARLGEALSVGDLHQVAAPPLALGLVRHLLLPLFVPWLRRSHARGDLNHQRHHNRHGAEIYLATPSLLAGSRRWSLHRAVHVDTAEVLLLRRFIGLDREDNTSPRDRYV